MKLLALVSLWLGVAGSLHADSGFPGLKSILSPAEWKRAGLDQLTPDQIGVIDAALIRYAKTAPLPAAPVALASGTPPPGPTEAAATGAAPAENALARARYWERYGLDRLRGDWRTQVPMVAKVTAWQGANRFALDTGQVWEGVETIPYELLGREITIEARPMDAYALKAGEGSLAVRVRRVK